MDLIGDAFSSSKSPTDLPNEVLTRILKYVIEGEDATFEISCGGLDGVHLLAAGKYKSTWSPAWVPQLRLVSRTFNAVSTPLLADHLTLKLHRNPDFEDYGVIKVSTTPLPLARLFPAGLVARAKELVIIDKPAVEFMFPVATIDLNGFSKLESVVFAACDLLLMLENTYRRSKQVHQSVVVDRCVSMIQRLWPDKSGSQPLPQDSESSRRSYNKECARVGQVAVMRSFLWGGFVASLLDEGFYIETAPTIIDSTLGLSRESMIGLRSSTSFTVELNTGSNEQFVSSAF